jgi:hypothetical protein
MMANEEEMSLSTVTAESRLAIFGDEDFSMFDGTVDQNLDQNDIRISRLHLCQIGTPEVASRVAGYDQGMWIDNINRQIYSEFDKAPWLVKRAANQLTVQQINFMRFVPICILPKEYCKWKDRNTEGNGMHWKSLDKNEQRVREGIYKSRGGLFVPPETGSKKPPVTENINILGYAVDADWRPLSPELVASFSKSGFRAGKFLVSEISRHRLFKVPTWGRMYYFYSKAGTPRPGQNDNFVIPQIAVGDTIYEAIAGKSSAAERTELQNYLKEFHAKTKELALMLTDKTVEPGAKETNGRLLQERYINAAVDNLDDDGGDEAGEDDGPIDAAGGTEEAAF